MSGMINYSLEALHKQAEEHQSERRGWHEAAMKETFKSGAEHSRNAHILIIVALLRPLIELAILIVLLVRL